MNCWNYLPKIFKIGVLIQIDGSINNCTSDSAFRSLVNPINHIEFHAIFGINYSQFQVLSSISDYGLSLSVYFMDSLLWLDGFSEVILNSTRVAMANISVVYRKWNKHSSNRCARFMCVCTYVYGMYVNVNFNNNERNGIVIPINFRSFWLFHDFRTIKIYFLGLRNVILVFRNLFKLQFMSLTLVNRLHKYKEFSKYRSKANQHCNQMY